MKFAAARRLSSHSSSSRQFKSSDSSVRLCQCNPVDAECRNDLAVHNRMSCSVCFYLACHPTSATPQEGQPPMPALWKPPEQQPLPASCREVLPTRQGAVETAAPVGKQPRAAPGRRDTWPTRDPESDYVRYANRMHCTRMARHKTALVVMVLASTRIQCSAGDDEHAC